MLTASLAQRTSIKVVHEHRYIYSCCVYSPLKEMYICKKDAT